MLRKRKAQQISSIPESDSESDESDMDGEESEEDSNEDEEVEEESEEESGEDNEDEEVDEEFSGEEDDKEDEDTGEDQENVPTEPQMNEPPRKKSRLSKVALYKPPTNEEMHQLKETENLFHSSLFRLQIDEMIREVQLKEFRRNQMDTAVQTLTQILLHLKAGVNYDLQDETWLKKCRIHLPLAQRPVPHGNFQFLPPKKVRVTGSFLTDMCVKPDIHVDVTVEMPQESFNKQDYMNHRYMRKRALYLCALAARLKKHDSIESLNFMYHHGNHLRPVLIVTVKVEGRKSVQVNLHPIPEEGLFKLRRFHVCQNNIRPGWFHGKSVAKESSNEDFPPTPVYNSMVLQDLALHINMDYIQQIQEDCPALKAGIALLKVWLRQRELDTGYGCFGSFIMTMYVALLLSRRKLNRQMSSYQIMRNTLLELSRTDWKQENLSLCTDPSDKHLPELTDFRDKHPFVFVDVTGYLNICAMLDVSVYNRVRHEAEVAMAMLEDKSINSFEMLFMKKVTFSQKFDHIIHISNTDDLMVSLDKFKAEVRHMELGGHLLYACIPGFLALLEKGLGKRVELIQVKQEMPGKWSIKEEAPDHLHPRRLTIGLILNEEFAFNVLDRGPSADAEEAQKFREFWGEKSELRRFQDGGICEAVLWANKTTVCKKRLTCCAIVQHLLKRHAGVPPTSLQYVAGQLDKLLRLNVTFDPSDVLPYGTGEEQSIELMAAFDKLRKILRNISDLPLKIHTIQGVSPVFRYSEVFTPLPAKFYNVEESDGRFLPETDKQIHPFTHVLNVVCMLESSGKWPDDIEAMRRLKAAFNLHLASTLEKKYHLTVEPRVSRIDVLVDGYVFGLTLAYTKEISVLRTVKDASGMVRTDHKSEKATTLEKEIIALPKISTTLLGIQQHNESYSCVVRLAKRWVTAQMLGDHIDEIAIELIVVSLFVSPYPYTVPGSAINGFMRFLNLLATFDWKNSPLMVNLNQGFTDEDLSEIPQMFIKQRTTLPLMFLSTPQDKHSSHWTKRNPSAPILRRMVLLAQKSLLDMQHQVMEADTLSLKPIFRPPLEVYDVLIHLQSKSLPRHHEAVDLKDTIFVPRYHTTDETRKFPVADFDPVQIYLDDLRVTFGDCALFFHDKHGGDVIGLLWKPAALESKDFKISHINGSMPQATDDKGPKLCQNVEAILETIQIMGTGLVRRLEIKNK